MAELTVWNKMTGIKAIRLAETNELSLDDWLDIRKTGIGGTDISAIAGLNPWRSVIDVYLDKTGRLPKQPENDKMKWGKILEEPVASEYKSKKAVKISNVKAVLQDIDKPHYLANIDRLILKDKALLDKENPTHHYLSENGNGVLEVKTTGWGSSWENDEIPEMYYCQVQWYMHVCKLKWAQFAVLVQGSDFIVSDIVEYNSQVGKNLGIIADRFWENNVLADKPPDVDNSGRCYESLKLLYPNVNATEITFPSDFDNLLKQRMELNENIKLAKKQKTIIDSKVLSYMQNNKYGYTDNFKVTRVFKNGARFDTKAFKDAEPDLYRDFLKNTEITYPLFKKI